MVLVMVVVVAVVAVWCATLPSIRSKRLESGAQIAIIANLAAVQEQKRN